MSNKYTPEKAIEVFWSRIDRSGGDDACWEWQATSRSNQGYGRLWWNGKHTQASRVAFEIEHGSCPKELDVLHSCDNPPCCNPKHLFLGTHTENMKDMARKGRHPLLPKHHNHARGEQNGLSKLTAAQVDEIRQRYAAGGIYQYQLAAEYGVVQSCISSIVLGKTWPR